MTRVEFRLSMPNRASWNGKWSGDERNYTLDRDLDDVTAIQLSGQAWSYGWPDGWRAEISARIVPAGEERKPSHGFHGYDWMVTSILRHGKIYADHGVPDALEPST